jgi:hypothetical protein
MNGFKISYVLEAIPKKTRKEKAYYIAPMVCFCDIPLSGVKAHLLKYGNYGLGIHKDICKQEIINPVFYIHNSRVFNYILPEPMCNFSSIIPYIKKYYEESEKGKFRLYDEREWRYVVSKEVEILNGDKVPFIEKSYKLNQNPPHYLRFNPNVVEYIIVENKTEITKMVDFIDRNMNIAEQEKKMLYTKIITTTRIKNDF